MADYKILSADSHIIEPPDMYTSRIDPKFRAKAPTMERRKTATGKEYDAWFLDGVQVATLGAFVQLELRFEDPSQIDFLGLWEHVKTAAYEPHAMVKELNTDSVWGAVLHPSQGCFWYRMDDSALLSAICRAHNDWIADFCKPYPGRLKGVAMLNVDDVAEACLELERCAKLGLGAAMIPVYPLAHVPYGHPVYERLWWTAQDLQIPLVMHLATNRGGIPGCEFTVNINELTPAGRCNADYWARYSATAMIFSGAFERYPRLTVGIVEHEMAWMPHWLKMMDFIYTERPEVFTMGWRSREGMLPSDYWHRNMFGEFMEDAVAVRVRDVIGVDNMLWGNDFPHAESTWPKSMEFLAKIFAGVPEAERRRITSDNAARIYKFDAK
jgi:predicted TIM-barrel fold metal-dependent hydrolase